MVNDEKIAHYSTAGLTLAQFRESKDKDDIFTTRNENYFTKKCQEQECQDKVLLESGKMDQDLYAEKQEQRETALKVLGNHKNMIPYYLLLCTHDTKLADAFKDATPDIIQIFAPLASTIYQAQHEFLLMASAGSFVSQDSLEHIVKQSLEYKNTLHNVGKVISLKPEEQDAILDPALFALLDHKRDMLTLEQIEVIEGRKEKHMKRIEDNTPPKSHLETLNIHFSYSFVADCNSPLTYQEVSGILAERITELETQINEIVAKPIKIRIPTEDARMQIEDARMQIEELERLRDMVKNLPTERKEEKEDILNRLNALCVLADPNREPIYRFLINHNPELRKIFVDASPELMDKTINGLCAFAKLHGKIQKYGFLFIRNIHHEIAKEYMDDAQYGSNDAEVRKAKYDFLLSNVVKRYADQQSPLYYMALCSTLVELYSDKDSGLIEEQQKIIAQKVAFHNQKPRNESQPENYNHYDRLGIARAIYTRNLVNPNAELTESDMPPPLNHAEIFLKVLEKKEANTYRARHDVRHNLTVHQEIQEEYDSLRGAQLLCVNAKARLLYNAALDHSDGNIREIAKYLTQEDIVILIELLTTKDEKMLKNSCIEILMDGEYHGWSQQKQDREIQNIETMSKWLQGHDRIKWESAILELFESAGLMAQHQKRLYQKTPWLPYAMRASYGFIRNIDHFISRYFSTKEMKPRGYYANLDKERHCEKKEILKPQPQVSTLGNEGESELENPHGPQSKIDTHSGQSSAMDCADSEKAVVSPQDALESTQEFRTSTNVNSA